VPAATPKSEAVRARMLETVWFGGVSFGLSYISLTSFGGLCTRAICLSEYAGSATRGTYAGVVADALAYDGLECEFTFVKHGGDGGQDVVSRVVCVEWRLGATWVAYVIG
jgi:hypothetical protein